ncbi:MAG: GAF domain-containing sensor histidine kinase [Symbiobacterium sp.]|uniref:GAF domain-containing sensor histidine kinase n=1 Tax=Symbiobacterium sp. TaxID=1971213 RepID=UPI00346491C9
MKKNSRSLLISMLSLGLLACASLLLPVSFPGRSQPLPPPLSSFAIAAIIALLVWLAQPWRVAIRGARGDISVSMAIDVAAMLLYHPFIAGLGSAVGTAAYHLFGMPLVRATRPKENRLARAFVRGVVTFAAVALGGWAAGMLRPAAGAIVFSQDWLAIVVGISIRLLIRIVFYPLGMAALRRDPVGEYLRKEWERLPLVPYLMITTLGGTAALIFQYQPPAIVLLFGPLAATWALSQEFHRLNELLATLEDKVQDRTARLAETVTALERRLAESEALHAVDEAISTAIHPDEVLAVIARESVRVTGGSSALVTLLTADGRQFVRATSGEGMERYIGLELPMQGNLTSLVLQTGQPHVSRDPENDPRLNQDLVRSGHWRDVIEAPIRTKDRTLGVLVVASQQPGRFDEQHMRLLTLLANQAGRLIENSELHAKAREVAVLEERNRLARELHDSVTQMLFGLTLNLESAASLLQRKPEKAAALVSRSQEMAAEALAEMRSLIFELRPAALQEKGLAMALSNHINLFRRRQGIDVSLALEGDERLTPEVEFALYRVAQEALNNVAKHARAQHVRVRLKLQPDEAFLEVCDDGIGFDPTAGVPAGSFGMIGMRERVSEVGGSLEVESRPGQGTCIRARIPVASGGETG